MHKKESGRKLSCMKTRSFQRTGGVRLIKFVGLPRILTPKQIVRCELLPLTLSSDDDFLGGWGVGGRKGETASLHLPMLQQLEKARKPRHDISFSQKMDLIRFYGKHQGKNKTRGEAFRHPRYLRDRKEDFIWMQRPPECLC